MLQLPTVSLFFVASSVLLLIGTSQGTYLPPVKACCDNARLINGRCVCNDNYYGDSTHKCRQPCDGKCDKNEKCDLYTFICSCKPGFVKLPYSDKCVVPCGGDCITHAHCNKNINKCECTKPYIGDASVACYLPSKFQLKRPAYIVSEDVGAVKIQVDRIEGVIGAFDVKWQTNDVSAKLNLDYKFKTGTVTFGNLQTTGFISIPIIDDTIYEVDEKFELTLVAVTNGGKLGTLIKTVVTIHDNDLPCGGKCKRNSYCHIPSQKCVCNPKFVLYRDNCEKPCFDRCCLNAYCNVKEFKCYCKEGFYGLPTKRCEKPSEYKLRDEEYTVKESSLVVKIVVLRTVSTLGPAKVTWVATDVSAKHGLDYIGHKGDIYFKDGQSSATFTIEIVNDQFHEEKEKFFVTLTTVTAPGKLISPTKAVIYIIDDDRPCNGRCVTNARCDPVKKVCVCLPGYIGNAYKECHRPCHGECLKNAYCDEEVNHCVCNKGLVGDGVKKCAPPCDDRCKNFKHSHCDYKSNRCVCDDTYHGDAYTNSCVCGTQHY